MFISKTLFISIYVMFLVAFFFVPDLSDKQMAFIPFATAGLAWAIYKLAWAAEYAPSKKRILPKSES